MAAPATAGGVDLVFLGSEVSALARGHGVHLGAVTAVLADRYGDRPAVEDPAGTPGLDHGPVRTHRHLEDAVARLAAALETRGRASAGERVLIVVDNRLDVALLAFAVARLGGIPVLTNHRLTARELQGTSDATAATAAIADAEVVERLPGSLVTVTAEELGVELRTHPDRRVDAHDGGDPDDVVALLTTSGTTGIPKAAALTSRGLLSSLGRLTLAPVGHARGPRAGRDGVFAALPLTHVMGFATLLGALSAGVPLIRRARFHAGEALDLLEQRRPNTVVAVPTMYADLERAGAANRDLSSVQLWVSSADAMPTDRARRFQRYGAMAHIGGRGIGDAVFVDIYGMVELSGAAAMRVFPPSPITRLPLPSFAAALPGIEVRAVDDDGRPVAHGMVGELQWRGPGVLEGYEGHDEGPTETGWFPSGDHGRVWPGGLFQFSGRTRDRLKVGGFSVFPAEVEEELREAPAVVDLAVVGVPDDRLGDRLVAVVIPGADFDRRTFLDWAEDNTAGYRRPSEVVEVDELPRGAHGKIDRDAATGLALRHLGLEEGPA